MPLDPAMIASIRPFVAQFISSAGVSHPPLPEVEECLETQSLALAQLSLDDLLHEAGAGETVQEKIDAMLDVQERRVWLKEGLHRHRRKTGALHEIGHDVLPWHRDLLYACRIIDLPMTVQKEMEREAMAFAVECLFFNGRFTAEAQNLPFNLATAKILAEMYNASYEAAFRHYVEGQTRPCCLLVSKSISKTNGLHLLNRPDGYHIQYYVSSTSFPGKILPGQRFTCGAIDRLFTQETMEEIVEHQLAAESQQGTQSFRAQSFTNWYRVFTLLSVTPFDP
ncbi:MAG: ImmA/IrrE family metallo-endopeptidase [Chloroflexota bacterium]